MFIILVNSFLFGFREIAEEISEEIHLHSDDGKINGEAEKGLQKGINEIEGDGQDGVRKHDGLRG